MEAIPAAQAQARLARERGDKAQEASALHDLALAYIARLGKKLGTCSIPSAEDSMGGLRAAKDAHALFLELGNREGQAKALSAIGKVLLINGVQPEAIESAHDPEAVFADVLSGKYTTAKNALPPKPMNKQARLEDVVPSSKQLEKGKFAWNNPTAGYSYTLIWQPTKDRQIVNRKPRGQYDILSLTTGSKNTALPAIVAARSSDASERSDPMVVFVTSNDCGMHYATAMISAQNTIAAMITARVTKLTFVQLGESHTDYTDTKARQVEMSPVTLAILRSARIEAPFLTIGFVGGDLASWVANPAPMIDSLFDTIESDECEVMYKRGEAFAPTIVHKPMEDTVQFVKPRKHNKYAR